MPVSTENSKANQITRAAVTGNVGLRPGYSRQFENRELCLSTVGLDSGQPAIHISLNPRGESVTDDDSHISRLHWKWEPSE